MFETVADSQQTVKIPGEYEGKMEEARKKGTKRN